ncbi:hypothetical protein [Tahibacter caeni]|uniref:hypothetical protein n=1 Tax=Tahibacter caeni TaxID=1453545 RepID=UPI0021485A33|nr:hypothetical protein [Tahibacter caeni]
MPGKEEVSCSSSKSSTTHRFTAASSSRAAYAATTREDRAGCRELRLPDATFTLACNHRAAARARGRDGFLHGLLTALRPDRSYRLACGDVALAELRNVVHWGRGSHLALTLADGAQWTVQGAGALPSRLDLLADGRVVAALQIEGLLRARLRMPPLPLPAGVAIALGWLALQVYGNDPHGSDSGGD